jgi:Mycobacterium membrane protein
MKRMSPVRWVMRGWLVLATIMVVAVTGFTVYRLHGIFGTPDHRWASSGFSDDLVSFNPKHITLEVVGPPGTVATINYLDVDAQPQLADHVALPWSYTMTTTLPAVAANLVAQGNSSSIGCRVLVNGVVKDERTVNEMNAYTFCLVKSV